MPKITLDTNVIAPALIGDRRGPSARIWRRILRKQDKLVTSAQILSELEAVLEALEVNPEVRSAFVSRLLETAIMIKPKHEENFVPGDPSDNKIAETAISGKASFIISGDKRHILPLKSIRGIRIVSPAVYLAEIGK